MSLGYTNYGEMEPYNDGYSDHVCRPENVEDFLTKVQTAVSQPTKVSAPFSSNWRARPNSTGQDGKAKYGDDREFIKGSDRNKMNSNLIRDNQNEAFPQIYKGTNPMINNKDIYSSYDRPRGNEGGFVPGRPVSKPTNDIGSAVEVLTESVKPMYDRPEKVEDFLTKVQTAVSQPTKVSAPFSSNWHARPNSTGHDGNAKYGDDSESIKGSDRNNMNSNLSRDKQNEAFLQIYNGTNPMINNKDIYSSYDRPRGNEGGIVPGRPLRKPTNDIGSAVEVLTESVKPMYGTNSQTDASRPIKSSPLSSIHWRTGSNLAAQDRKVDSDDDDDREKAMHKQVEQYDVILKHLEPTNRINNKEGHERPNGNGYAKYFKKSAAFQTSSEQPRFSTAPAMQNKETYSSPETIDSNDLLKKYNGTKVP